MGREQKKEFTNPIDEIVKELRSLLEKTSVKDSYSAGVADAYRRMIMRLDAVRATTVCPKCGGPLILEYSERVGEMLVVCNRYECDFIQILNQIGY